MISQELINYIKQRQSQGIGAETIKSELRQAGWQEADIQAGFNPSAGNIPVPMGAVQGQLVPSKKFRRLGMFFIIGPIIMLAFVLVMYAVVSFLVRTTVSQLPAVEGLNDSINYATNATWGTQDLGSVIMLMVNVVLGFIAIISVLGIIVGTIIGIIFFNKKELVSGVYDERSGKGRNSVIPPEIKGWNWGAFGISMIWGIYYGAWMVLWGILLNPIPILGIAWLIFVGLKGNEWAWRKNKWESVEKFMESQNKWKVWGIVLAVLSILSMLSGYVNLLNNFQGK